MERKREKGHDFDSPY